MRFDRVSPQVYSRAQAEPTLQASIRPEIGFGLRHNRL